MNFTCEKRYLLKGGLTGQEKMHDVNKSILICFKIVDFPVSDNKYNARNMVIKTSPGRYSSTTLVGGAESDLGKLVTVFRKNETPGIWCKFLGVRDMPPPRKDFGPVLSP